MNFLPATVNRTRIALPMVEFELPGVAKTPVGVPARNLVVGIRPEHFQHADSAAADRFGGPTFNVTADLVEWLGADTFVHFQVACTNDEERAHLPEALHDRLRTNGQITLTARLDPAFPIREGDRIPLWLDARKLHFFDGVTGRRV